MAQSNDGGCRVGLGGRPDVQPYAPDSWGPPAADALVAPYGWALGPHDPDGSDPKG